MDRHRANEVSGHVVQSGSLLYELMDRSVGEVPRFCQFDRSAITHMHNDAAMMCAVEPEECEYGSASERGVLINQIQHAHDGPRCEWCDAVEFVQEFNRAEVSEFKAIRFGMPAMHVAMQRTATSANAMQ